MRGTEVRSAYVKAKNHMQADGSRFGEYCLAVSIFNARLFGELEAYSGFADPPPAFEDEPELVAAWKLGCEDALRGDDPNNIEGQNMVVDTLATF